MKSGRRTTAFYVETLLMTFFLLIVLCVLVRMFSAARAMGIEAKQETAAALIARNAAAEFSADTGGTPGSIAARLGGKAKPSGAEARFRADGTPDANGEYSVRLRLDEKSAAAGRLVTAEIQVRPAVETGGDGKPLCSIQTEKYLPNP